MVHECRVGNGKPLGRFGPTLLTEVIRAAPLVVPTQIAAVEKVGLSSGLFGARHAVSDPVREKTARFSCSYLRKGGTGSASIQGDETRERDAL